ncbi:uncharacterized protein RCC_12217 [Ramularia collo-cygni]|uniref:Uncharacterized protein n=1 Tax=Ramularia collo-cygni TaxID=112498 RepID=A0A2D3UM53_9PEZI|nr:uncharacterized protein RCC_12217 [Ramularia collo-cygni]CZT14821.1 uncharacterized protein RCC_12217 [Ramularia collo-cygni]
MPLPTTDYSIATQMESPSPEDELLIILLRNLQNAASTFGEGTPPYESVRATVEDHLREMRKQNKPTNITKARAVQTRQKSDDDIVLPAMFENLAIRTKSSSQNTK